MKGRITRILFLIFFSLVYNTSYKFQQNKIIFNALELFQKLANQLSEIVDTNRENKVLEFTSEIDSICSNDIRDTLNYDIDYIINEVEKLNKIEGNITSIISQTSSPLFEIVKNELRFRVLTAMQHNMEMIYSGLSSKKKFSYTILFASLNTQISETKTYLLNRQIGILSSLNDQKLKLRFWVMTCPQSMYQ